jgi:hypothetical protein
MILKNQQPSLAITDSRSVVVFEFEKTDISPQQDSKRAGDAEL